MGVPRLWRWLTGAHKQCVRFAADAADLATWLEEHSGLDAPAGMDALAIDLNATIHNANLNPDGGIAACDPLACSEELFNQVFGLAPKQLEAALQLRADPDCMEDLKREFALTAPPEALALSDIVNAALDSAECPRGDARLRIFLRSALLRLAAIIWTMAPGKALFVALDGPAPAAKFTQQRERRYRSSHGMFTAASSGSASSVLATQGFGPIDTVQGAAATSSQLYDPSAISPGTALMRFVDSSVRHLLKAMATAPALPGPGADPEAGAGATAGLGDHAMASTRPPRVVGAPATVERRFVAKGALVVYSGAGDAGEGEHKLMALLRSWLAGGAAAAGKEALRWQGSAERSSGCWGRAVADESGLFWWEGSAGQAPGEATPADSAAPRGATVTFWGPDGDALVLGLTLLGRFGAAAPMTATEAGAAVGAAAVPPLREVVIARDYDKAFRREWRSQMKADRRAAGGAGQSESALSDSDSESSDAGGKGRRRGGKGKGKGSKRKGGAAQRRRSSTAEAAAEARAAGLAPMPEAGADWDSPKPDQGVAAAAAAATAHVDGGGEPSGRILSRAGQHWLSEKGRRVRRPLGSFVSCRQLAEHLFDDTGASRKGGKRGKGRRGGAGAGAAGHSHAAVAPQEGAALPPAPAPRADGTPLWALAPRQSHRCIDLAPVMCVMGNDFLPRPEALDLDSRGMANLLSAYREAEEEMARASRGAPLGDFANVPAGAAALPWRPLVACMTDDPSEPAQPGVVIGLRFLARFLWRAAADAERADLSSALDGIARMSDSDDGAPLALPTSGVVGASGAMGVLKQRSVSSAGPSVSSGPASDPASLILLRRIRSSWTADGGAVHGGLDEEDLGGSARGDWYSSHMSGCGPMRHVREVANGAGGDAASGAQGEGPWPSDMAGEESGEEGSAEEAAAAAGGAGAGAGVGAGAGTGAGVGADAAAAGTDIGSAVHRPHRAARRLPEASVEDTLAIACEAWVAGLGFTCAYYLTGLPSWRFRYPFAHSPMLSDVGCWAACAGGRAAGAALAALGLVDARVEDGEASLAVPVGGPLCAAAHCASVITPYSLHLLPPTLRSAMTGLLPWAPVTSPGALLPVRPAGGGAPTPPGAAADAAAHPIPPLEAVAPALRAAVGSSSSPQAWWFPAWEDVRQDSEKAMADWQVKLWIPLAGVGWAERAGRAWEAAVADQEESTAFRLPTGANIIVAS